MCAVNGGGRKEIKFPPIDSGRIGFSNFSLMFYP